MTPGKCPTAHKGYPGDSSLEHRDGVVVCDNCEARWVPETLLREAGRACGTLLAQIPAMVQYRNETERRAFAKAWNEVGDLMRRIDAALGGHETPR